MFLPFHDDNPTQRKAVVTYGLIAVNVVVLLWFSQLSGFEQANLTQQRGFMPARLTQLGSGQPITVVRDVPVRHPRLGQGFVRQPVQIQPNIGQTLLSMLTCMFLHAGWLHLLGNMWFLWLFGNNVEDRLGHVAFLAFYLVGGGIGSFCHWAIDLNSQTPVIGASGAVAAVLGAYAVTWPWARIHTLVFVIIFFTVIDLPALAVLGVWFLIQLVQGQAQLGLHEAGGVAFWAHVGGFLAGMALMPLMGWLMGLERPIRSGRIEPTTPPDQQRDRIIDVQIIDDTPRRRY